MSHTSKTLREAFHYLYPNELPALKQLAKQLPKDPSVVNIGAGAGTSGLAFLESRKDLYLVTVDIQKEDSPFGCLTAEEKVIKEAGLWKDGRSEQVHGDSKVVGRDWSKSSYPQVDMVFIDGDHSYEGCKGDILAWLPNIKSGGFLAVHDYKKNQVLPNQNGPHPKAWPGVDQAVDELLMGKFEMILRVDSLVVFKR